MSAKILVVDDDLTMLKMVETHLVSAGYDVDTALEGSTGISRTKEWDPELILLDIMMPAMDGFTTCEIIREFSAVPIIFLTAKGEESDLVRGLDAGADDYVVKPFSSEELLARVRAVLRRGEPLGMEETKQKIYRHLDLEVNLDRASVTIEGREIVLTATEFRLLTAFSSSMGRVLTPEDLLAKVWGTDYRQEKAILWVTLSRLRQKIERDPRNPIHIVTRQGMGYIMPRYQSIPNARSL
jgi:DNA-binding response OmpR family regulator